MAAGDAWVDTLQQVDRMSRAQLDGLVEEATADCYNEDEQITGLFTMIEANLAVPFQTTVFGVEVTVEGIDLTDRGNIVATCRRGAFRQAIPVLALPLPRPAPAGTQMDRGIPSLGRLI